MPKLLLLNGSHDRETSARAGRPGPMGAADVVAAVVDALNRRHGKRGRPLEHPPAAYVTAVLAPAGGSLSADAAELSALGIACGPPAAASPYTLKSTSPVHMPSRRAVRSLSATSQGLPLPLLSCRLCARLGEEGLERCARCVPAARGAPSEVGTARRRVVEVDSVRDASGQCLFEPAALVAAIAQVVRPPPPPSGERAAVGHARC